jgi:hypothetical protein
MQNNSPTCLEESNNESYVPHELRGPHGYFNVLLSILCQVSKHAIELFCGPLCLSSL